MINLRLLPFLTLPLLASCVAPSRPPAPTPAPRPAPAPAPAPTPTPTADWSTGPLTPGEWVWQAGPRESVALFGASGGSARAALRCERANRRIRIERAIEQPVSGQPPLALRTSFALRSVPVTGQVASPPMLSAELPASDPLFDQMIYSRGRFVIEGGGQVPIIVPARPEIARVVEDCRS